MHDSHFLLSPNPNYSRVRARKQRKLRINVDLKILTCNMYM